MPGDAASEMERHSQKHMTVLPHRVRVEALCERTVECNLAAKLEREGQHHHLRKKKEAAWAREPRTWQAQEGCSVRGTVLGYFAITNDTSFENER